MECGWYALCSKEILGSSYLPLSNLKENIRILFPRCPDISSATGIVGKTTRKTKRPALFLRRNDRLNFTGVPRRPQHLPTLGKQILSLRLPFLLCGRGRVCTLSKIMGCLMSMMLAGEKRLAPMKYWQSQGELWQCA